MAQEFKTMIDRTPLLTAYLPRLKTYLLTYPKASLPGAESFLYWQSMKFGMKPTIRINHVVIAEDAEGAAVATKMLYANHYFLTAIELRVLVPDPARGKGFWFANVSQTRSDGLSGYLGPIIRAKVRDQAHKDMWRFAPGWVTGTLARESGKVSARGADCALPSFRAAAIGSAGCTARGGAFEERMYPAKPAAMMIAPATAANKEGPM